MKWIKENDNIDDTVYRCSVCYTTIAVENEDELPDYCKFCESEAEFDDR